MVRSRISCFKRRLGFLLIAPLFFLGMCQTYAFGGVAKVEKSGQTKSYSTGDDGDLQKGVKWPNPRFNDNGDGTVTDNLTKLIWLKDANAFGERTWKQALSAANTLASGSHGLTDGSKKGDWRLPNLKEFQSLLDFAYRNPALSSASGKSQWTSGDAFTDVRSDFYWSSTTCADFTTDAWNVDLRNSRAMSDQERSLTMDAWNVELLDGHTSFGGKTSMCYVWPVRAGQ